MKTVYIASPYAGDIEHNTDMARKYCRHAAGQGVIPLAPHLLFTQFLNDNIPEEREQGCRMGMELLSTCDELWVCGPRISNGMMAELAEARRLGIQIQFIPAIEMQETPIHAQSPEQGMNMGCP